MQELNLSNVKADAHFGYDQSFLMQLAFSLKLLFYFANAQSQTLIRQSP